MIRLVRRPAFPGELNHELVWPLALVGGALGAWGWFLSGLTLPGCIFFNLTGLPCLGCGGTRCVRSLVHLDFTQALRFHPGFFLVVLGAAIWAGWSLVTWLRRDPLRLRLAMDESGARGLRWACGGALVLHWLWQVHVLAR